MLFRLDLDALIQFVEPAQGAVFEDGLLLGGCEGESVSEEPTLSPGVDTGSPPPLPPEPAPLPEPTPAPEEAFPGWETAPGVVVPMPPPLTNGDEREEVPREELPDMSAPVNGGFPAYPWPPEAPSWLVPPSWPVAPS